MSVTSKVREIPRLFSAVLTVFFVLSSIFSIFLLNGVKGAYYRFNDLSTELSTIASLQADITMAETGQQGFDLTGIGSSLTQYREGWSRYQTDSIKLLQVAQSSDYLVSVESLISEGTSWHDLYGLPQVEQRMSGHPVTMAALSKDRRFIVRFDAQYNALKRKLTILHTNAGATLVRFVVLTLLGCMGLTFLLGAVLLHVIIRGTHHRRRLNAELLKTSNKLSNASRVVQLEYWEWQIHTDVVHWSRGLDDTGTSGREETVEEFIGRVHPADRPMVKDAFGQLRRGVGCDIVYRVAVSAEGERTMHMVADLVLKPQDGTPGSGTAFATVQDITERRRAQALMTESERLSGLGQFAAAVAHEIRNPLTTLKGFLQISHTMNEELRPDILDIMRDEVRRIETIVGELLMLAKPQAVPTPLVNVHTLLDEVYAWVQPWAKLQNVKAFIEFQPVPLVACVDYQIKQVLTNVVENALESMPQGGGLHIRLFSNQHHVIVEVQDHGVGIEESRLKRIGEPFYSTKEKGTGLGLTISRRIMHMHKGALHIMSQPGIGTTVRILLPTHVPLTARAPVYDSP